MTAARADTHDHPRSHVLTAFVAVYVVWGSTYLAIRYGVQSIPPFTLAATRFLVSGTILYWWARRRGTASPTWRQWRDASIAGIFMLTGGNGGVVWAEQRVPSGVAALLAAIVPLWIVLIEWWRPQGRRPGAAVLSGVFLGLCGLVLLVWQPQHDGRRAGAVDPLGATVLVIGSLSWAIGSVFNRHGDRPRSAPMSTAAPMFGGGAALLVLALTTGEITHFSPAQVTRASALGWLYLVAFGSLVGFTAYIYLLRATTAAKASTYAYVNPLVAVVLGWVVAGEPITPRTLVAAAVILAGVALITMARSEGAARRQASMPS